MLCASHASLLQSEEETHSYLVWVMRVLEDNLMSRIKASPNDEVGIVFYSTVRSL